MLVRPGADGRTAVPGTLVPVRLTGASAYDLEGEVVGIEAMVGASRQP